MIPLGRGQLLAYPHGRRMQANAQRQLPSLLNYPETLKLERPLATWFSNHSRKSPSAACDLVTAKKSDYVNHSAGQILARIARAKHNGRMLRGCPHAAPNIGRPSTLDVS